jgi:hypothetical protein
MPYEYQLILTIKDGKETVSLSGSFQADAWSLLNKYLDYADDLLNTKFVRSGMPASMNIKWEQESGMVVSTKLPDWDDVTVFLHKFRPIGLQSEDANFYKICNILAKELAHPYVRNMIDEQREIYTGKRMQSMFRIQSDDIVLNSEKVLNDWLNSFEYHRDKEKRKFIESLHEMFPLEASKVLFLGLLSDKTQAIRNIAIFIRVVVGRQKSVEGLVRLPS